MFYRRSIIQDAIQSSNITSDKFREIQKHIETTIQNVNPSEEYREFTEKHKTSPASPIQFQFDETLIEDTLGKLQANTLTVDNLTVDWLRNRLNELEVSVKECQENQCKLTADSGGGGGANSGTNSNTNTLNSNSSQTSPTSTGSTTINGGNNSQSNGIGSGTNKDSNKYVFLIKVSFV